MSFNIVTQDGYRLTTEDGFGLLWTLDWTPAEITPEIWTAFNGAIITEDGFFLTTEDGLRLGWEMVPSLTWTPQSISIEIWTPQ